MKKISRIKLIFAALPIVVIALLLFLQWDQYGRSYKSLADWGTGKMGYTEQFYYLNRIGNIIKKWQDAGNNIEDTNSTFLHLDFKKNAIWLEENGQEVKENYSNFPENISWQLSYSAKVLPERITIRTKRYREETIGNFSITGINIPKLFCVFDTKTFRRGPSSWGSGLLSSKPIEINSLIISEEEYKKYRDSLEQTTAKQSIEKETPEQVTLRENKSRWLNIEKYLYMEIEGQVRKAGYELDPLESGTSPNYSGAYMVIQGYGESVLYKLVNWVSGTKKIQAYFKIDYLGDDIWYARTASHPNHKLKSDRKLNLEFLIYPQEQITRSQCRKYIKLGRKTQKPDSYLSPKWKTSLPNDLSIKLIGISSDKEPDTWWGPDGSALELPEYVKIEPLNNLKDITFIAWQIKQPENEKGIRLNYEFDSPRDIQAITISNRYGNFENVIIAVFDNSREKTDFKIIIKNNEEGTKFTAFKNISLIKGKDQGFVIEH